MRLIKYKKNPTDKVGLRYLLVGKADTCGMPDEGLRKRMRK